MNKNIKIDIKKINNLENYPNYIDIFYSNKINNKKKYINIFDFINNYIIKNKLFIIFIIFLFILLINILKKKIYI